MKNQVRPVCSPKDKIWSRKDKLQRCRRLPLEQAKLRQILENKSEGVLIRKWFDRWYVAESLCDRLRGKINHVLILQQHQSRRGRPIFPYGFPQNAPGWIYPLPDPHMFNDRGNPSPSPSITSTDSLPESLQFSEDSSMLASTPTSSRRTSLSAAHSKAWCLFTDFVLKCDCSFPDKFFVTGGFQVGFVQSKSEISLQCDLALREGHGCGKTELFRKFSFESKTISYSRRRLNCSFPDLLSAPVN